MEKREVSLALMQNGSETALYKSKRPHLSREAQTLVHSSLSGGWVPETIPFMPLKARRGQGGKQSNGEDMAHVNFEKVPAQAAAQ